MCPAPALINESSLKPELRFCAGSNPACSMLEIHDDEDISDKDTSWKQGETLLVGQPYNKNNSSLSFKNGLIGNNLLTKVVESFLNITSCVRLPSWS